MNEYIMITFNSFWLVASSFSVDLKFTRFHFCFFFPEQFHFFFFFPERFHFCIHMDKYSGKKVKFFRLLKIFKFWS